MDAKGGKSFWLFTSHVYPSNQNDVDSRLWRLAGPMPKSEFNGHRTEIGPAGILYKIDKAKRPLIHSRAFVFVASIRSFAPPLCVPPVFDPLICAFLDWARVERGFSSHTVSTYKRSVQRFVTEASAFSPERITSSDVLRVKRALMDRGCSASYIATIVLATRCFLLYCRDIQRIALAIDPSTISPPSRPRRQVTFLLADEVARFVNGIRLERRWLGNRRVQMADGRGMLYRALVETLLGTGMRISEALSLRRSSIDWVRQEARVVGKGSKERTVFFTERSLSWLSRYLDLRKDEREELFVVVESGAPVDRHTVVRWFQVHSGRVGLNKKVTAHVLRHTVATTLMFNGCPMGHIKEILGHERLDTTCRYYLGVDTRQAKAAMLRWLDYDHQLEGDAPSL